MTDLARLTLAQVHALTLQVLHAHGVSVDQAQAIADTITAAERDDCQSHGLFRLPGYVSSVLSGKVTPNAVPQVRDLVPAIVQVDGQNGFAPAGAAPRLRAAGREGTPSRHCRTGGNAHLSFCRLMARG